MTNKKQSEIYEFFLTYGWAILSAIIVVLVLWYMVVNSDDLLGIREPCYAEKVCEDLGLEYSGLNGKFVFCDFLISDGIYSREELVVNYTKLKEIYPECANDNK